MQIDILQKCSKRGLNKRQFKLLPHCIVLHLLVMTVFNLELILMKTMSIVMYNDKINTGCILLLIDRFLVIVANCDKYHYRSKISLLVCFKYPFQNNKYNYK